MRQGEALLLTWADVEMLRRELFVRVGSQDDDSTKNRISRMVVMFDQVHDILSELPKPPDHKMRRDGGFVFWHLDDNGCPTNYKRFASQWRSFREGNPVADAPQAGRDPQVADGRSGGITGERVVTKTATIQRFSAVPAARRVGRISSKSLISNGIGGEGVRQFVPYFDCNFGYLCIRLPVLPITPTIITMRLSANNGE